MAAVMTSLAPLENEGGCVSEQLAEAISTLVRLSV